MLKKTLVVLGLMALVLIFVAASQNPVLDFKLVNKTGSDIQALFISPADVNDWEEDVLGQDVLEDGATVEISFHPKATATKWDLKVEDEEETGLIWENLDLSKINTLTLKIVDGKPIAEIK